MLFLNLNLFQIWSVWRKFDGFKLNFRRDRNLPNYFLIFGWRLLRYHLFIEVTGSIRFKQMILFCLWSRSNYFLFGLTLSLLASFLLLLHFRTHLLSHFLFIVGYLFFVDIILFNVYR